MITLVLAALIGTELGQFDDRVLHFFTDVVLRAALSNDFAESAAFLVRDGDGGVRCLLWPTTDEYQKVTYRGTPPQGTIAIVHTHPVSRPKPSAADIELAQLLRLPMYVVTRSTITVIEPFEGAVIPVVEQKFWMVPRVKERCEVRSPHLTERANAISGSARNASAIASAR